MSGHRLPRRQFLAASVGAVAASELAMGDSLTNALPRLGFSLYGMKSLPLDVAIRSCVEIGYSHVELSLNSGYATEPSTFSAESRRGTSSMLKELKLDVPCLMVLMSLTADQKTHAANLELIAVAAQMGKDLVPENPPILETVLGGSPGKWDEQKSEMASRLSEWAAAAEQSDTTIAIKAHVGSAVNSPERLLWLLDEVKSSAIQVAYDFSHFELQGIDMASSMKSLLPRTRFIHVKDTQGDASKFQFLLPGEGRTDYVRYFSLLREHRYTGPVCVEVSGQVFNKPDYSPLAAARQCFTVLSEAMQKAFPQSSTR